MKKYILPTLLLVNNSYAAFRGPAQASCSSVLSTSSTCGPNSASGTTGYASIGSGVRVTRHVAPEYKGIPSSTMMAKVRSSADEVDSILTMVDRKGTYNGKIFQLIPPEVKTFQEEHIKALLEKMLELKKRLHAFTVTLKDINSKEGKEAIVQSARYYSFMGRIHQIMANAAHSQADHHLDYNMLKDFSLVVDKRVGLEILSRMNLNAQHIDAETLRFTVSEEEKQNFEFNAIQNPGNVAQYAKLVQFMSIRAFLSNRWALERLSTTTIDNPKVAFCGPKMLSFKPGPDGTMGSSAISSQLEDFDIYFSKYPSVVDPIVKASKNLSILNNDAEALELTQKVFKGLPTLTQRLTNEFGWTPEEIDGWQKTISETLKTNEDSEWAQYADTYLKVSVFPGDDLRPDYVGRRVVEDIFSVRKDALIVQFQTGINGMTEAETAKMQSIVSQAIESRRGAWEANAKTKIVPLLSSLKDVVAFKQKNYADKVNSTKEIAKSVLPSAFISEYIIKNNIKRNLSGKKKLPIQDLEPKSVTELVEFFQVKLAKSVLMTHFMDHNPEFAKIVSDYFEKVTNRFNKLGNKLAPKDYQIQLWKIAKEEGAALIKQFPQLVPKNSLAAFQQEMYKRPSAAVDNTRVYQNKFVPLYTGPAPKISDEAYNKLMGIKTPPKPAAKPAPQAANKPTVKPTAAPVTAADSLRTPYNMLSLTRLHPAVADNTRVKVNRIIPDFEEKEVAKVQYVHVDEYNRLSQKHEFVREFLGYLGINVEGIGDSFLTSLGDQNIIAESRLANAYNSAPLLKIPLARTESYTTQGGMSITGADISHEVSFTNEKPALIRMLQAVNINITNATYSFNDATLTSLVKETIQTAINNQKGKTSDICTADHTRYSSDEKFKTLFRSSTFIRQGITTADALSKSAAARLQKLDEQLKKETRYFSEMISEDYLNPMMNAAMVVFIVSAFIIPALGSAGILAPGSVMLAMTLLDGLDLAITGASLYHRSVSAFYEVPAQVKFQKSLAYTQVENFKLTTWDDVSSAESAANTTKILTVVFAPLDMLVGGQFYGSTKRLLGITGKNALVRQGVKAARGFGRPPKSLLKKSFTMTELIKDRGVLKGIVAKGKQEIGNLKYWTPRYQTLTHDELTNAVRLGLVTKAAALNIAHKPWAMVDEIKAVSKKLSERLEITKVIDTVTGNEMSKVSMAGKLTFKEFLSKPNYAKQFLVPMSLIRAVRKGELGKYISEFGEVMKSINKLRGELLRKRRQAVETMMDKLADMEKVAASNPNFLAESGKANWMDHFQSLLSDDELHAFKTMVKTSNGATLKEFKKVFKDQDKIMEGLVSMTSVSGRAFAHTQGTAYSMAEAAYENGMEISEYEQALRNELNFSGGTQEDLWSFYLGTLREGGTHIEDADLMSLRREIEDQLGN